MAMTLGRRGTTSSEINVTPMIDVLLVLLIIFMVLFPHQSTGEAADIPQQTADPTLPPPDKPVVIQVLQPAGNQKPTLKINEEEVGWQDLGSRLQKIFAVRNEKVAFMKGDPEVTFHYVADAIDIAHHAGAPRVGLMGK